MPQLQIVQIVYEEVKEEWQGASFTQNGIPGDQDTPPEEWSRMELTGKEEYVVHPPDWWVVTAAGLHRTTKMAIIVQDEQRMHLAENCYDLFSWKKNSAYQW